MVSQVSEWVPAELNALALAFIGDAVWDLRVRDHVLNLGNRKPNQLHRAATRYVNAAAQARLADALWPHLTPQEQDMLRRGRNAKSAHVRKNADVLDYRHSTGFEALIGYLYGTAQEQRLDEVCRMALQMMDEWEG